jgi:hypothetical protein
MTFGEVNFDYLTGRFHRKVDGLVRLLMEKIMEASELLQTNDAQVWAQEFMACKAKNGWSLEHIDEGLMIAWFANAMAAQEFAMSNDEMNLKKGDKHEG